jgi:hypothetical protein
MKAKLFGALSTEVMMKCLYRYRIWGASCLQVSPAVLVSLLVWECAPRWVLRCVMAALIKASQDSELKLKACDSDMM